MEEEIVIEKDILIPLGDQPHQKNTESKDHFEMRSVTIPPNRLTAVRNNWDKICETIVQNMKLQIRMNTKKKSVDVRECDQTEDKSSIQKTYEFLKAYMLGFTLDDSIALLRLDDLFVESFLIKDVKTLHGDHMSRCIARLSGEKGKTKHAIENATKTRIIIADTKIHLMGSYNNIRSARDALCSLILGTPPSKVYSQLRFISKRLNEQF
jgi:RNA-binding protein PNO1